LSVLASVGCAAIPRCLARRTGTRGRIAGES
jgi:hypothetical protein